MSEAVKRYAVLETGTNVVENIILANESFVLDGYTLQLISNKVFCEPGMYYNVSDELYYQNPEFTTIYPAYEADSL
ncbi:hypothetical protein C3408_22225 [Candidatus Pantoea alvi]|nr:hypothetical protein C3408_22225 [Pantoea alvi]